MRMKESCERINMKRLNAIAVFAAVLAVTLLSSIFIVREADHDCAGAACPTCAMIEQCEDNLRRIGTGQIRVTAVTVAATFCCFFSTVYPAVTAVTAETLVTRKVRLNN